MTYYEFIEVGKTVNGEYTISTIKPSNSNIFETAIMLTELGDWHIVAKYKTLEDAAKGHNKYCDMNEKELETKIELSNLED